ncbi:helix-turn-helix domain-containing protein [Streptomyces sp. C11-1]|uniref:Helix-turn-helix domain-containing protein n=1 Tax=Streptomyces durocortorensis TaxID=2811104 RepID=A0ABY9VYH8_9ACTN|nr:helix-turn-helix domain-containing protein [Streptomyces durocortorensis]WNF28012.1 helix-turn-helix domain-containing protein [Streptomyces durocortorensis]
MQRIHFTASDLARTRLQSTLGPVAEGVFALGVLARSGHADYARWRGEVLGRLRGRASSGPPLAQLLRNLSAPDDLLFLLERTPPADGTRQPALPRSDAARLALDVWRTGVAPYWERIQERLEAECEARGRIAMTGGVERLLATLHPRILWNAPVLEIHDGPDREVRLDGRGVLLCPSVFMPGRAGRIVESERESGMAALVFATPASATRAADLWGSPDNSVQALSALVGQTRAAALRALTAACTTSQLADRLGISSAGASQHAAILRQSGLITTRRVRNNVLHIVTPLGMALLGGRLRDTMAPSAGRTAADLVQRSAAS